LEDFTKVLVANIEWGGRVERVRFFKLRKVRV
jgi:hypothetical protein